VGFSIKNNELSVSVKGGKFSSKLSFLFGSTSPSGPEPPHSRSFLDHTKRHTTLGRTPVDE